MHNKIKKAISNYKSRRRVKKLLKAGTPPEKNRADGTPEYGYGGTMKSKKKKMKKGGSFPDLNKDGKVTRADVLKGRDVFKYGGVMKKSKSKSREQYD